MGRERESGGERGMKSKQNWGRFDSWGPIGGERQVDRVVQPLLQSTLLHIHVARVFNHSVCRHMRPIKKTWYVRRWGEGRKTIAQIAVLESSSASVGTVFGN